MLTEFTGRLSFSRSGRSWPNEREKTTFHIPFRIRLSHSSKDGCSALVESTTSRIRTRRGVSCGGDFPNLSRSPALRHRSVETCAASLRRALRLGYAGKDQPTGQQRTENDSALRADGAPPGPAVQATVLTGLRPACMAVKKGRRSDELRLRIGSHQHSGHYGFPLLFHFMDWLLRCPHKSHRWTHQALFATWKQPYSFLGGSFVFCFLVSFCL